LVCKMLNMLDLGIGSDDVEEMWIVSNKVGFVPTYKPAACMLASYVLPFAGNGLLSKIVIRDLAIMRSIKH